MAFARVASARSCSVCWPFAAERDSDPSLHACADLFHAVYSSFVKGRAAHVDAMRAMRALRNSNPLVKLCGTYGRRGSTLFLSLAYMVGLNPAGVFGETGACFVAYIAYIFFKRTKT